MNQVAKAVNSIDDALIDLFESTKRFLKPLEIYIRIPPTPAIDEIMFKIIAGLLYTLALATRELKEGRSSKPILPDVLIYSAQRSQIRKRPFRREAR